MHIAWDWNPIIFTIVLVVSLALATKVEMKVAWLLPAFVLYFGLDWTLSAPWSILKLVFWLAVIVVVATALLPGRTRLPKMPLALVSCILVLALLPTIGSGLDDWINGGSGDDNSSSVSPSEAPPGTPTATATVTETAEPTVPTAKDVAAAITKELHKKGFKPNEWTAQIKQKRNPADVNKQYSFSQQRLFTNEDVSTFLNGSSSGSEMARTQVTSSLDTSCDRQRALDGSGYVPIQFKIGVQYGGNTYKDGDKIITPEGLRQAKPGDVIFLFVDCDGKVNWAASIRADCGNGSFTTVVPVHPGTPQMPPVTCVHGCTPPPCTHCAPPPPKCVEIPRNGAIDCGPGKSGNFHGGGEPQGTVHGHGTDPVHVQTHHSGGGGVTDNASNPPGSETGGHAGGGATPPDPNHTPNPPEGGSGGSDTNDGSAGSPP